MILLGDPFAVFTLSFSIFFKELTKNYRRAGFDLPLFAFGL